MTSERSIRTQSQLLLLHYPTINLFVSTHLQKYGNTERFYIIEHITRILHSHLKTLKHDMKTVCNSKFEKKIFFKNVEKQLLLILSSSNYTFSTRTPWVCKHSLYSIPLHVRYVFLRVVEVRKLQ